ncbi:hypothetical protein JIY74_34080 [Vibrio harveyi]|nr:hypothetical protein [Vibrio harveyi]
MYIKKKKHNKTFLESLIKIVFRLFIFSLISLSIVKLIVCIKIQELNFNINFIKNFDLTNLSTIDKVCNFTLAVITPLFLLILFILKSFKNIIKQKSKIYYLEAIYNSDFTECLEIGYFTNNKGEVQIEQFPVTVKKVPSELPKFITSLEGAFMDNKNTEIEGIQH